MYSFIHFVSQQLITNHVPYIVLSGGITITTTGRSSLMTVVRSITEVRVLAAVCTDNRNWPDREDFLGEKGSRNMSLSRNCREVSVTGSQRIQETATRLPDVLQHSLSPLSAHKLGHTFQSLFRLALVVLLKLVNGVWVYKICATLRSKILRRDCIPSSFLSLSPGWLKMTSRLWDW